MCTAIRLGGKYPHFGRTLDYEYTFGEEVVLLGRDVALPSVPKGHLAILGMAHLADGFPLYYDALNECGVAMAGLNFVGNAIYEKPTESACQIPPHLLIPAVLARAESVEDAISFLANVTLCECPYSDKYPIARLHYMIADRERSVVAEPRREGLLLYDNPYDVLTNNPPFPMQEANLLRYDTLCAAEPPPPEERWSFSCFTRGRGSFGLPGDLTSASRFVRAAFYRGTVREATSPTEAKGTLLHLLDAVSVLDGAVRTAHGNDRTQYSSCMDLTEISYAYTTYENRRIRCIRLSDLPLDKEKILSFPLHKIEEIAYEKGG